VSSFTLLLSECFLSPFNRLELAGLLSAHMHLGVEFIFNCKVA